MKLNSLLHSVFPLIKANTFSKASSFLTAEFKLEPNILGGGPVRHDSKNTTSATSPKKIAADPGVLVGAFGEGQPKGQIAN